MADTTASMMAQRGRAATRTHGFTRAIVINSPNNPSGRVLVRSELEGLAAICIEFDLLAITDEIYECPIEENQRLSP
jgi:aspartate/methionine/tyrosine aminotransferase